MKITMQVTSIERNNWAPNRATVVLDEVNERGTVKDGRSVRMSLWDTQTVDFQYGDVYQITIEEGA